MPWATVNADTSWQDIAVCSDLALQYNYRARFLGLSDVSAPTSADKVFAFVADLQDKILASAFYGSAVNPSASFTGVAVSGSYPDNYAALGLTQLYSDAGLPDGLRRVASASPPADWTDYDDPAYSYGKAQAGDMIGPWLFKDLQTLLDALYVFKVADSRIFPVDFWTSVNLGNYNNHYLSFNYETPDHNDTDNRVDDPADVPAYPPDDQVVYTRLDGEMISSLVATWSGGWQQWEVGGTVYYWYGWDVYQPHYRLYCEPYSGARGNAAKKFDFYACVDASTPGGEFWDFPFGAKSSTSKLVGQTGSGTADVLVSGWITSAATTASELLPARAAYDDSDGGSARLHNLVCRVEITGAWASP